MRRVLLSCVAALAACAMIAGCGSSASKQSNVATAQSTQQYEQQGQQVNCDEFMQQLADGCFYVTAFDADNMTPRHVFDEEGNDLGEVDQIWAAGYCECYAQLAFQTFGCLTVIEHENLDDASYAQMYEPIVATCSIPPDEQNPDGSFPSDTN